MNDPDQVIRIPKLTLQLTILDAEERGYKKAVEALYGDGFDEAGEFLDKVRKKALKGGE